MSLAPSANGSPIHPSSSTSSPPIDRSEEIGKYFIIVENHQVNLARREVSSLLRIFQSNSEAYGNHFPRFPCIANGPLSNGSTERTAASLSKKFSSLQSEPLPNTQSDSLTAWTPSRTECVFDWQSTREFPAPTTDQPSAPPSVTRKVTISDDAIQARSTRSVSTTDVDTTVSDLKTVFTESMAAQSKMLQQFMENSQQQQQQLMAAHQSQQASTTQILHQISSLMSTMVSGAIPSVPTGNPNPSPLQSTPLGTPAASINPPNPIPPILPKDTQQPPLSPNSSQKSPNKFLLPYDNSPDRRRSTTPQDTDVQMSVNDDTPNNSSTPTNNPMALDTSGVT
jgi:hypothetical protein